ncbi:hypothetical protein RJT34_02542 [Clitoria ternatea]|uniref:Uncharacterized protein n=1 Tax=Clitoria ternatea TaxID=43366 RepID=A0AAN9KKJ1_CLITE
MLIHLHSSKEGYKIQYKMVLGFQTKRKALDHPSLLDSLTHDDRRVDNKTPRQFRQVPPLSSRFPRKLTSYKGHSRDFRFSFLSKLIHGYSRNLLTHGL